MPNRRTLKHELSFVLHHYPWSESSLILEVFTRLHGRLVVMAKGVKRPTSSFRAVLLPLQPLSLSLGGVNEILNLKSAEWLGGHLMPQGGALLAGLYLNELVLRLLAREDPHPLLFDQYRLAVSLLAAGGEITPGLVLRAFELLLLRSLGVLPNLDLQTFSMQPLRASSLYQLTPEGGLLSCGEATTEDHRLVGERWLALHQNMQQPQPLAGLVRLLADWDSQERGALKHQLRQMLHHHSGARQFKSSRFWADVQTL